MSAASRLVAALVLALPLARTGRPGLGGCVARLLRRSALVPAIERRWRWSTARSRRLRRDDPAGAGAAGRGSRELRTLVAVPTLLTRGRRSTSRSSGWRSTISAAGGDFISRCCPTGPTPPTETVDGDDALLDAAADGIARLNAATGRPPAATGSCCCTAGGSGTRGRGGGWAGSASAASSTS